MAFEIEKAVAEKKRRRAASAAALGASIALLVAAVTALLWGMIPFEARVYALLLGCLAGALLGASYYLAEPGRPSLGEAEVVAEVLGGEGLGPAEKALVEALARMGGRGRVAELAEAAGLDVEEVIPMLVALERRGAVRLYMLRV